jgi:hypothetical protein
MKVTENFTKTISAFSPFILLLILMLGCGQLSKPTRKESPDFQILVSDLEKEANANSETPFAKYKNKTVAVKGRVEAKMDMSVILVSPENVRFPVQCFFDPADRESFQQIQQGREYTLIGIFTDGDKRAAPTLSNCKVR